MPPRYSDDERNDWSREDWRNDRYHRDIFDYPDVGEWEDEEEEEEGEDYSD